MFRELPYIWYWFNTFTLSNISNVNFAWQGTYSTVSTATVLHLCLFSILNFHGLWSPEGFRGRAEWCSPVEKPSGLKNSTWLQHLHQSHRHLVKLAMHAVAVFQIRKDTTLIWMGPFSMEVLWLERCQMEQRKFKGQLCRSFICISHSQKPSNWKRNIFSEIWNPNNKWVNCSSDGPKIRKCS